MKSELARDSCPACGMSMITAGGFGLERSLQTQECLRCGYKQLPTTFAKQPLIPDVEQAKRFRDKAAEAEQLASCAQSETRRETLIRISRNYLRTAEQFEGLKKSTK